MKTITQVGQARVADRNETGFALDTTFVLFFLGLEFGQSFKGFSIASGLLALTLIALTILPYFLATVEKVAFKNWIIGRILISAFAVFLGWLFKQSLGIILPETFRFLPMTLLIVTAMVSCYIQFYGFVKLRLVK